MGGAGHDLSRGGPPPRQRRVAQPRHERRETRTRRGLRARLDSSPFGPRPPLQERADSPVLKTSVRRRGGSVREEANFYVVLVVLFSEVLLGRSAPCCSGHLTREEADVSSNNVVSYSLSGRN